ncbi:sigma-70 family RNA polymerase sigma factor [Geobacter hydrogenophilus]|uniref:Uncharacterized protein n=1 Tax=Geobacter hydrogenophilus TaxID=40983 RepID=A0A9W6LBC9_9BACT|nr:sigma-70 family RNA polymerase sigma factor [Geobacter hydrogenophilus]MBT0895060.1 sigma-70 family RNA polymerase sigma factor [Geobacter hydrogenophilus]GLI36884.1 hypothetical protein GHYDROH2_03850 [Geobacter hydrogenophilus]
MTRFLIRKRPGNPQVPSSLESDDYREFLNENLDCVATICEKAASGIRGYGGYHGITGEGGARYVVQQQVVIDADELFIQAVDHLREDDYRRLREFKGRSSLPTYLTTVISRLVVDIVRQRTGRNRARERAERYGTLGSHVYELMVGRGHTADEAVDILQTTFSIQATPDQLREIHEGLLGRRSRCHSDGDLEMAWGEEGELVVVHNQTPEDMCSSNVQRLRCREILEGLIDGFCGEERLILRLRFPIDDVEPCDVGEIAVLTGLSPKQVDRKIRYILKKCREELLRKGVSFDDLV